MPIDFHAAANRYAYAGRTADDTWRAAMREIDYPAGPDVVDIGCGAGTYSHAWLDLGAASVTGVDFSREMLAAAREGAAGRAHLTFVQAEAADTRLPDASADVVFERALLHHVADALPVAREARRLLRATGTYIIQDRDADDVRQPGSPRHLRGYLLERHPKLLDIELRRRPDADQLSRQLRQAGFSGVETRRLWEVRRTYETREGYLEEIRRRTGRSILHELSDDELGSLVDDLRERLPAQGRVVEMDRWTLWIGRC